MKIEHLEERINDYRNSIKTVVEKKNLWNKSIKPLLLKILNSATKLYDVGWKVQELNWIHNNEAVNITFDSFPPELINSTNQIPTFQFYQGGALIFSQSYNGDVYVFIAFPILQNSAQQNEMKELGFFLPKEITEKFIIEKIDDFLKEMILWELPMNNGKIGYQG
ncbi:hypothetical protein [Aquimarina agarivorans]|uniref:hypothetical protein n=1 Tax=Aquimarina agarivorans TaxID=980584 RepID=UPI000248EBBA|nr:hypothetical protein [Aquimarina agarivorans]